MARKALKALKDTTKALGGLGAAYFLSEALGPTVKPQDVDPVSAARDPETVKKMNEKAERDRVQTEFDRIKGTSINKPFDEADETLQEIIQRNKNEAARRRAEFPPITSRKEGGVVSASKRADGMAQRGKTRGKMV
jgi:hypothetical protein